MQIKDSTLHDKLLQEALNYVQNGASVIPVGSNKVPLISWKEFQERKPTRDEVVSWWTQFPMANVGIVTGKISNLVVVDIEKGGDISKFPETDTVSTGGGGHHLYYSYADVPTKTRVFPLTDLRGDGGYVVAPPSIHANGNSYTIIKMIGRKDFPVSLFSNLPKLENRWDNVLSGVSMGSRNDSMTKLIGRFIRMLTPDEWENHLWPYIKYLNSRNTPPLSDDELRGIFLSIARRVRPEEIKVEKEDDSPILLMSEVARIQGLKPREFFSTGIESFDKVLLGGFMSGDLTVITGPTGEGKTSFAQTLSYNLAKNSIPVMWFSYEVMIEELWRKFLEMGGQPEMICYSPLKIHSGSTEWIRNKIIDSRMLHGTKVIVIDHLGFLVKKGVSESNISSYLGAICRELKTIALDLKITILLISHIRKVNRGEITAEDLGFSAGIAQEADTLFVVKRDRNHVDGSTVFSNTTKIKIEKNRRTGNTIRNTFEMKDGRFIPTLDIAKDEKNNSLNGISNNF